MGVEQRQLLAAVDGIEGIVDIEGDALGTTLEASEEQIDHRQPHARERAPRRRVLEARQGWLAHQIATRLGQAATGQLERRIETQNVEVVAALIGARAYRWQTYRTAARLEAGGLLGSASSMMKVFWSELDVELHATALRLLGDRGELVAAAPDAVDGGSWMAGYLFALSGPIYAGTNEIQRNIIAERVLGLPRK